jgi:glycosyltransferase involved in cell wall biosynthesis
VGETTVPTGYARIADSLLPSLRHAFDIHQLSTWPGGTLQPQEWPCYFTAPGVSLRARFGKLLDDLRPDLVLVIHDLRTVGALSGEMAGRGGETKSVCYAPVDVVQPKRALVEPLRNLTSVVAFTETQASALREILGRGPMAPQIEVLPPGVDTKRFRRLAKRGPRRDEIRRALFGGRCGPDTFVVLNANRNHVRKRLDVTVEGFALFARSRPEALLCLHCGPRDTMGWDLERLVDHWGIADRVVFTSPSAVLPDADDDRLNLIYNACDVGLNTSVGEGWGLTSVEHAATGAAQVVPDHTACGELWDSYATLVPATLPIPTIDPYRDEQRVHAEDVADALGRLYDDRLALQSCSEAAYGFASQERFSWSRISEQWRVLLSTLVGHV